jgi:hypothetical protein
VGYGEVRSEERENVLNEKERDFIRDKQERKRKSKILCVKKR